MTARLVHSSEHTCTNSGVPMVWQPAGRRWYCQQCKQTEGNGEYLPCRLTKMLDKQNGEAHDSPPTDQPEPTRSA